METFADRILDFYSGLKPDFSSEPRIHVMIPFREKQVQSVMDSFYRKFYSDSSKRLFIFGINPGRFGAGTTGITFTDPIRLEKECGIPNDLPKKHELSSIFIYDLVKRYGGPEKFFSEVYLTAVCPVGFTKNGKNMNFYDDRNLMNSVTGFIVKTLQDQIAFGACTRFCVCLGEGKNFDYLRKLNDAHHFFGEVIPLAHPRFIMQYRLKKKEFYLEEYMRVLQNH